MARLDPPTVVVRLHPTSNPSPPSRDYGGTEDVVWPGPRPTTLALEKEARTLGSGIATLTPRVLGQKEASMAAVTPFPGLARFILVSSVCVAQTHPHGVRLGRCYPSCLDARHLDLASATFTAALCPPPEAPPLRCLATEYRSCPDC